jgi:hypothetical protein
MISATLEPCSFIFDMVCLLDMMVRGIEEHHVWLEGLSLIGMLFSAWYACGACPGLRVSG